MSETGRPGEAPDMTDMNNFEREVHGLKSFIPASSFVTLLRKFRALSEKPDVDPLSIMTGLLEYTQGQSGPARQELVKLSEKLFPVARGPNLTAADRMNDDEDERETMIPGVIQALPAGTNYRDRIPTLSGEEPGDSRSSLPTLPPAAPVTEPPVTAPRPPEERSALPTLANADVSEKLARVIARQSQRPENPHERVTLIDDGTIAAKAREIVDKDLGLEGEEEAWMKGEGKKKK